MRNDSDNFSLLPGAVNSMERHNLSMEDIREVYLYGTIKNKLSSKFIILESGNITIGVNPLLHRINTIRVK